MVSSPQVKSIIEPSLTEVLFNLKLDIFATMNCVKVGQITSFDVTKKTAQVQILFRRVLPDGTIQSYPLLIDCPVYTPQGGGGALQFPITAGDQCLLLFSDRRLDEWYQTGGEAAPGDPRMHHMSDAICLVGINALNSSLANYPTDRVVLSYKGSRFELTDNGWNFVSDEGAEVEISDIIDLTADAGGELLLDDKVLIRNTTTTLLTVLNGFIDVLKTLQVTGPLPLTAGSIAALETYKTTLATLLE